MKKGIQILKPCHENWDKMSPAEKGRFCGSCQKQVHDVTTWTDTQIKSQYYANNQQLCIRIPQERLSDPSKAKPRLVLFLAFVLAIWLSFKSNVSKAFSISPISDPKEDDKRIKLDSIIVKGSIQDTIEANEPLAFAAIQIRRGNKMLASAISDLEGNFNITVKDDSLYQGDSLLIQVNYVGFKELKKYFKIKPVVDSTVYLESGIINLDELRIVVERDLDFVTGIMVMGIYVPDVQIQTKPILIDQFDTKTYYSDDIFNYNFGRD